MSSTSTSHQRRVSGRATKGVGKPHFEPNTGGGLASKTRALLSTPESKPAAAKDASNSPSGKRPKYIDVVTGAAPQRKAVPKPNIALKRSAAQASPKAATAVQLFAPKPDASDARVDDAVSGDEAPLVLRRTRGVDRKRKVVDSDDDDDDDTEECFDEYATIVEREKAQLLADVADRQAQQDQLLAGASPGNNSDAGPASNLNAEAYADDDFSAEAIDYRKSKCEASMITKMELDAGGRGGGGGGGGGGGSAGGAEADEMSPAVIQLVKANGKALHIMSTMSSRLGEKGAAAFDRFVQKIESSKSAHITNDILGDAVTHFLELESEQECQGNVSGAMAGAASATLHSAKVGAASAPLPADQIEQERMAAAQIEQGLRMAADQIEQGRMAARTAIAAATNSPQMNSLYAACAGLRDRAQGIYRRCITEIDAAASCEDARCALQSGSDHLKAASVKFMFADNGEDPWEMYRASCAAAAGSAPGGAAAAASNAPGVASTGATGSGAALPAASGASCAGAGAGACLSPAGKGGSAAGARATHSNSRGEAQQAQTVADDPYCDPDDEDTWETKEYNRDDPAHQDVIYYDVERKHKNDCRKRGGRFDWACNMWFGDAAESDTIKLLDSKYKRKPCQPTKRWSQKEARYALCFADRDTKAGMPPPAAVSPPSSASSARFCTSCGAAVSAAFCGKCGARA